MRLRILAVVLGFAAVGVLFVGGYLTTRHVDAQIQGSDVSGFLAAFQMPCGSVVSPKHEAPPAGWEYSGQSCAQKLAWLRHGALVWARSPLACSERPRCLPY